MVEKKQLNPKIIYQDDFLLVINKPTGLVVNRSQTARTNTLQDWLEKNFIGSSQTVEDKASQEFLSRSGLVHRLDKDTSGLMVCAKDSKAFLALKQQFAKREVVKGYMALVHGLMTPKKGDIALPLARNPKNRFRHTVRLGGRQAKTFFQSDSYYSKDKEKFSLITVFPKTGRTHQIRVHFSFLKHGLVADPFYLSARQLNKDLSWCPRLFLHAFRLGFYHPVLSKKLDFSLDLPRDLKKALQKLER